MKYKLCNGSFFTKSFLRLRRFCFLQYLSILGDGSGSVFAMRHDFKAEKTTLQEECERQQRLSSKFFSLTPLQRSISSMVVSLYVLSV